MKLLITSDQHWHIFKEFDKLNQDGTSYRLSLYRKSLKYIIEYCVQNKIRYWVDCGDLFHSRESISTEILDLLGKTLKQIKNNDIKIYFIKGNHDTGNRKGDISTLNILSEYGEVVDECKKELLIDFNDESKDILNIGFIPWDENLKISDAINRIGKCNLIFAHRMLKGAKQGGMILDGEDVDSIDQSLFDYMFVGHIHGMQKLTDKIVYVGSLMACNFNDEGRKSFFVYDTNKKEYEIIKNPFSPLFIQRDIRKVEDLNDYYKNAFYDFKIVSDDENETEKILNKLENWKDKLAGVRVTVMKKTVEENRVDSSQEMTPENILKQFIELNSISQSYANVGYEILKESV